MDMETRGRSRSKTPFTGVEEFAKEFIEKGSYSQNTVIHSTTYRTVESTVESNEELTTVTHKPTRKSIRLERNVKNLYRTSDYSSEDGETEVSSTKIRSQNDKNQLIADARAAANGNSEVSALDLYKKSGRYWDVYPKTDWTYSPHSRDRVELAPGVVAMPNMSRKAIHASTTTAEGARLDLAHKQTNTETLVRRQASSDAFADRRPRQLFNNNYDGGAYKKVGRARSQWQRLGRPLAAIVAVFAAVWRAAFRVQTACLAAVHRLAGRVMLLDTWLLWKGGRVDKPARLAWLCAAPLLLLGGWYILTNLGGLLHATSSNPSPSPLAAPSPTSPDAPPLPAAIAPPTDAAPPERPPDPAHLVDPVLGSPAFLEATRTADRLAEELRQLRARLAHLERDSLAGVRLRRRIDARLARCCARPPPVGTIPEEGVGTIPEEVVGVISEEVVDAVPEEVVGVVSEEAVERVVRRVLRVYDADRTGLADYAMESMGGQVVSTRCTEPYRYGKAVVSLLGVPLWQPTNSPRAVITPGASPGECWAFQGFPGFVVVRLAKRVHVQAVSLEHISRLVAPDGDIGSAPKEVQVLGLRDEEDVEPVELGRFEYDAEGEPVQVFAVREVGAAFEVVELRVLSNHGNPNYTCLYRFRVHGRGET